MGSPKGDRPPPAIALERRLPGRAARKRMAPALPFRRHDLGPRLGVQRVTNWTAARLRRISHLGATAPPVRAVSRKMYSASVRLSARFWDVMPGSAHPGRGTRPDVPPRAPRLSKCPALPCRRSPALTRQFPPPLRSFPGERVASTMMPTRTRPPRTATNQMRFEAGSAGRAPEKLLAGCEPAGRCSGAGGGPATLGWSGVMGGSRFVGGGAVAVGPARSPLGEGTWMTRAAGALARTRRPGIRVDQDGGRDQHGSSRGRRIPVLPTCFDPGGNLLYQPPHPGRRADHRRAFMDGCEILRLLFASAW